MDNKNSIKITLYKYRYTLIYRAIFGIIFLLLTIACNRLSTYSMNSSSRSVTFKEINTLPVAHMVAQIRSKQLSIKDVQNKLLALIKNKLLEESMKDNSRKTVLKLIIEGLERDYCISNHINDFLEKSTLEDIGYEIKTNKTPQQLLMALEWVQKQKETFITNLLSDKLYHGLSNDISPDELPTLQSPSDTVFWGNENSSVSTAMLISIAATLSIKLDHMNMPAAATAYPFRNRDFKLPNDLVPTPYPFASQRSMLLIDTYQYGGQRNWYPDNSSNTDDTNQLLLGPEDCSSAVGKATYCTTKQVKTINTNEIIKAYYDQNNLYHYCPVTCLHSNISDQQLKLIHPGSIYIVKGHTAIVASKPDQKGNVITLQFNRDIHTNTQHKQLGGGLYTYDLATKSKERTIYFLCKEMPCKESSSLENFMRKVQEKYETIFPNGPVNILGNCKIFYE